MNAINKMWDLSQKKTVHIKFTRGWMNFEFAFPGNPKNVAYHIGSHRFIMR